MIIDIDPPSLSFLPLTHCPLASPASKLRNGTQWRCGVGTLLSTLAPSAATTSWMFASNARQISRPLHPKIAKLHGALSPPAISPTPLPCSTFELQGRLQPRVPLSLHQVYGFYLVTIIFVPSLALPFSRWLKNRHVCPLCNREWDFQKYGS
jgi:hypothetical protein